MFSEAPLTFILHIAYSSRLYWHLAKKIAKVLLELEKNENICEGFIVYKIICSSYPIKFYLIDKYLTWLRTKAMMSSNLPLKQDQLSENFVSQVVLEIYAKFSCLAFAIFESLKKVRKYNVCNYIAANLLETCYNSSWRNYPVLHAGS